MIKIFLFNTSTACVLLQFIQFHISLAPYKVAVTIPDSSNNETQLKEVMDFISRELRNVGFTVLSVHDTQSSLESRFKRQGLCMFINKIYI